MSHSTEQSSCTAENVRGRCSPSTPAVMSAEPGALLYIASLCLLPCGMSSAKHQKDYRSGVAALCCHTITVH